LGHSSSSKLRIYNHTDFGELGNIVALHNDYLTAEPSNEIEYEMRLQKIGNHYRGFKRLPINSPNFRPNSSSCKNFIVIQENH